MNIFEQTIKKSIKEHHCDFCDGIIEKGDGYFKYAYADDRDGFQVIKMHLHCKEVVNHFQDADFEYLDDYYDTLIDYYDSNNLGSPETSYPEKILLISEFIKKEVQKGYDEAIKEYQNINWEEVRDE